MHLNNGFSLVSGAPTLQVGDTVTSTSKIAAVTNSDSGKTVLVHGTVYLVKGAERQPVIEVESSFLYRGKFDDFATTFDQQTDPAYVLTLKSEQDVAVLKSKDWFDWLDDDKPLNAGTSLVFRTDSSYNFKTKDVYSAVECTGSVTLANEEVAGAPLPAPVADISYSSSGPTKGNPVVEYLQRFAVIKDPPSMFESPYTLTSEVHPSEFVAPYDNLAYSNISGDVNPIHVNPYFADLAGLPGTISHGMFSSAATRRFVEQVAAGNKPERVVKYKANFVGMVLPNAKLQVVLRHIGQNAGNKMIEVTTTNVETGDKVLVGSAEVAQAQTAYVFTGQGSQEQGMGMELYNTSEVAKRVWDEADRHLGDVYGFSIIDIVRGNPQELTVHFGGLKGQTIRKRYMDLFYHTADKDGTIHEHPLFPDIDLRTTRYTFSHPTGLLFATQFAQIALVVTEKAAFEDMRAKGLIQDGCPFAGHSLGEYSALASIADVLPISSLVDVVFYRGITMQRAVERDEQGRSSYGMCAINPSRIGKTFSEVALREVVEAVSRRTDTLLQIVNFNVEGQQYVAAGELVALHCLGNVLNFMKLQKIDLGKLMEIMTVDEVKGKLDEIIDEIWKESKALKEKSGWIKLERGFATIPLPGIDVPFHSRYLWAGVMPFRTYLSKKIDPNDLRPELLEGRYIPNLVADPFRVTKEYAQKIFDQTASPRLEKVLAAWDSENWGAAEKKSKLGYIILVELLAYQFASPVRWIETQNLLFGKYKSERYIELGPSPTLAGMGTRTLKLRFEAEDISTGLKRDIFCVAKHQKEIYYQLDDAEPASEDSAPEPAAPAAGGSAPAASAAPAAAPAAPAPAASGPAVQVPDEPLKAVDTLRAIIAQKLKKPITEVPLGKAIKDLVGGKSTLQNEVSLESCPHLDRRDAYVEASNRSSVTFKLSSAAHPRRARKCLSMSSVLHSTLATAAHLASTPTASCLVRSAPSFLVALVSLLSRDTFPSSGALAQVALRELSLLPSPWSLPSVSVLNQRLKPGSTPSLRPTLSLPASLSRLALLLAVVVAVVQVVSPLIVRSSSADDCFKLNGTDHAGLQPRLWKPSPASKRSWPTNKSRLSCASLAATLVKATAQEMLRRLRLLLCKTSSMPSPVSMARTTSTAFSRSSSRSRPVISTLPSIGFAKTLFACSTTSCSSFLTSETNRRCFKLTRGACSFGRLTAVDRDITARCLVIMNRADPALLDYMRYHLDRVSPQQGANYKLAKEFGTQLLQNCEEALGTNPLYKDGKWLHRSECFSLVAHLLSDSHFAHCSSNHHHCFRRGHLRRGR